MPETLVTVGGTGARADREFPIRVNGPRATFKVATDQIEAKLIAPINDLLLDLLDIACVVFCADSTVTRGGLTRPEFGDGWRRSLSFNIPVRCPEVWQRREVVDALTEAVRFLTDDDVQFEFLDDVWDIYPEPYLDFGSDGRGAFRIDEVMLFSGGLDSLAGALEVLATTDKNVALVSHESANKIISHQRDLVNMLKGKYPGRVLHIPVKAHRVGVEAKETTQRSRSFLFAAIAHVIARVVGAPRILFFENGIVSHNLPISKQVVGTMATRTTHPMSLHLLGRFLDTLGGPPIPVENAYRWLTKTDVIQRIAHHGGAAMIRYAVSCTSVREQSTLFTHCGSCSQCLDRRFAILAAGLEDEDPAEQYAIDVLFGIRKTDRDRIIAVDWTRHAVGLSALSFAEFTNVYIGELTRIVSGYPDTKMMDAARRVHNLHQRQANIVISVLEQAVTVNAQQLVRHTLPDTSLLRLVVGPATSLNRPVPVTVAVAPISRPKAIAEVDAVPVLLPLQVAFFVEGPDHVIKVKHLGTVRGRPAGVAHALRGQFEADSADGLSRDKHRFVPVGRIEISGEFPTDKSVRQLIKRCRSELGAFYKAIFQCSPPQPLLIENKPQKGYRLDPDCRVIARDHAD